jgi:hypothetical protein
MAKTDKDRLQKDLAIKFALARSMIPFLEVVVRSIADLSDSVEVLTDLDVLGVESAGDGGLRRAIFDCKTTNKMSAINRAFWAAGIRDYTRCDEAYVILKSGAVHNHRISALAIGVDLHDEKSFRDLGKTTDPAFPSDELYQSSVDRWNALNDCYSNNGWANVLFDLSRNVAPLSQTPWGTFRKMLAELRVARGQFDPAKDKHVAIFFDVLASTFVLWATLGRDIRRFYEPSMDKAGFEKVLRYYLWGGKESYNIRQQLREKGSPDSSPTSVELPQWPELVSFASIIVGAPRNILECAIVCREFAIRCATGPNAGFDKALSAKLKANSRTRQFSTALGDYLVGAGNLPKDMAKQVQKVLFAA